ncbi:hypothetical protein LTR36_002149 [Oleoguttula mirabilis]|uniref:Enoyl reductase (ER) domain-containing protein n=1 Tax=Oleoguttula mirabilis TaxID=1507867 RepID=A0AAV9JMC6_9PEZI|nr:hypothetical protein LTR36_002149 [Oleoguttula mirabilis]
MKAAQWGSSVGGIERNIQVVDVPLPLAPDATRLPAESTLVRVAYSSLNPVDYKFPELPFIGGRINHILGSDFAGTVVSTTLPDISPGQRVFGMTKIPAFGALAEYAMVHGSQGIAPVPDGVPLRDVAALGVAGLLAYQAIVPFVREGDKVFVNGGSGGIGHYAVQIAKILGCSVTATCSGPNLDLVKSLGADDVIDYRNTDVVAYLQSQGTQYTVLFDTVSTPAIYWSAHHYLKPSGSYNCIPGDTNFATVYSMAAMFLLPVCLGGGQRKPKFIARRLDAAHYAELATWVKEGRLKTAVEHEYELDAAAEAFARLKSGRTRGKLLIRVAEE